MSYIIEITIPFSIGAVVGYFFRLFIEDKVIRKRDRDNRYALAYNAFSKEITSALHRLANPKERADDIIREEFPRHKDAFFNFEHMVSGTKGEIKFKEKWKEYDTKSEKIYKYILSNSPASDFPDLLEPDGVTAKDFNKILKQLIEELLEIAKKH